MDKPPQAAPQISRNELPHNSNHGTTLAQPQISLASSVFNTLEANVQGAHMILRSFPELDLANSLNPMVNQLKTLLDAAQVQVARANNLSVSMHPSRQGVGSRSNRHGHPRVEGSQMRSSSGQTRAQPCGPNCNYPIYRREN